jgi:uncharacterized protein YdhG (YjbR/CyaY superfamily)
MRAAAERLATMKQVTTVDEYLEGVPEKDRAALEKLRRQIRAAAPDAEEVISYRMPMFKLHGMLAGYAAFADHLSMFVSPAVIEAHSEELEGYKTSKGTIQFKADKPLPASLVKKLVEAGMAERGGPGGKSSRRPPVKRPRYPMPDYVERELEGRGLAEAYRQRPPYQQNDYIGWITRAKQETTRRRRLEQMLEELERGDVYMKMAWKPRSSK